VLGAGLRVLGALVLGALVLGALVLGALVPGACFASGGRMRTRFLLVICLLAVLPREAFAQLRAVPYATGFSVPVAFIQDPSNPANQFVVQQDGRIRLVRNGVVESADFMDIHTSIAYSIGSEQGLLGMAIPGDYATSGRFYVYFNAPNGDIVVARFKRDSEDPLTTDQTTRFDLRWSTGERFIQHHTFGNHNGGNMAFGPDGYLYLATGDGGSGNDPQNNAQNMNSLLGKMLRIDVSVSDADPNGFAVPPTNPFVGSSRPEIWSVGLRNPWRWSFDDPARGGTGALVIGDVGQSALEEIDYEPAGRGGRNYGWPFREGTAPGANQSPVAFQPLTDPIFVYGRSSGSTVTGGIVYRGSAMPSYAGRYFFGDFGSGRIWSLALSVNPATGEATALDLRDHSGMFGPHAVSTFGVDAAGEMYFANYFTGIIWRIEPSGPSMSVDKPALNFGAVQTNNTFVSQTPAQTVRLTQSGVPGTVTWTIASNAPWLTVSPTSGTGPAVLTVAVQRVAGLAATQTANLTFSFSGAGPAPATIPVLLRVYPSASAVPQPTGAFDTPLDNATNLSGSIAVTGWAVDFVGVSRVRIWRDPVAPEAPGALVFIGDATLVEGARPDVATALPIFPMASRAGWGYLLLTNFLPNLGNGTFRLHAFAESLSGNSTPLGSKMITVDNANATAPFGAIDTPDQGALVSGTVINWGWVLARNPRRADPPDGGAVQVLIDGNIMPFVPGGWASRSDITALFPAAQYPGVATAVGHAIFDSTTLTNGVHTIAWVVTDNLGAAAGIGSRYFTVANSGGSLTLPAVSTAALLSPLSTSPSVIGRRGFDPYGAYETFEPGPDGIVTIAIPEMGRIELWLGYGATAQALTSQGRAPLPIGSHFDPDNGRFTWNPGAGFVGAYDFTFNGRAVRIIIGSR
jgi:glucose/arabinose dehydrogenase